jgi:predicted alpha-1,6-mannanase (GH76 family)
MNRLGDGGLFKGIMFRYVAELVMNRKERVVVFYDGAENSAPLQPT